MKADHWIPLLRAVILMLLVESSVHQRIELCELPEKDSDCTLKCDTKDYTIQPVTYSHPPQHDVGSCIPPNLCRSNYDRYDLSQVKVGNSNITMFHIKKLNREKDQGEWICSYGNRASPIKRLTVHTRPDNVKVNVTEDEKTIRVKCLCYCVYPEESIRLDIELANEEKTVKRRLDPPDSFRVKEHNCSDKEITMIGSHVIEKKAWPGHFIDIRCICTELKLSHSHSTNKRHHFQGVPKSPQMFDLKSETFSAEFKWKKAANGGSTQTFVLEYVEASTNIKKTITLQEKEHQEFYNVTVSKLKPNTEYEAWIFAYNRNGNGSIVGPLTFRTTGLKESNRTTFLVQVTVIPIISVILILLSLIVIYKVYRKRNQKGKNRKRNQKGKSGNNNSPLLGDDDRQSMPSTALKGKMDSTKALIEKLRDETFYQTKSFIRGREMLNENDILIYKGAYGDGRFTNAVNLMGTFAEEKKYTPVLIEDITKWDELVDLNRKLIVLIPDILTKVTIDKKLYERVYTYWMTMMSCVQCSEIKIIMTCETVVMTDLWDILRDYDIFREEYHIDLSDKQFKLTAAEKESILTAHCEINHIQICTDEEEENYETANDIDKECTITIRSSTIKDIVETDYETGFPQNCVLFCKHRGYLALGKKFFLQPKKYMIEDIDNLHQSDDIEKSFQRELLRDFWYSYSESQCYPENKVNDPKFGPALRNLTGTYIKKDEGGKYLLKHETIYIAVGLSLAKEEPEAVIRHCNWNFLRYNVKSTPPNRIDEDFAYVPILENVREAVIERYMDDLNPDTFYRHFKYMIACLTDLIEDIFKAFDKREDTLDMVKTSCCDKTGVLVQACRAENSEVVKELLKRLKGKTIPKEVLKQCKNVTSNEEILAFLQDEPMANA